MDKLIAEGGKAIGAPGNVGEQATPNAWCCRRWSDLGRLDLLVNNAGTPGTRRRITPPELDLDHGRLWGPLLETNLLGVFRCSKAAAPALKAARGAICQYRLDRRAGARPVPAWRTAPPRRAWSA